MEYIGTTNNDTNGVNTRELCILDICVRNICLIDL